MKAAEYVVSLRGIEIGRWQTERNCLLAVSAIRKARPLPGKETREPAYGVPARWIQPAVEEQALAAGYSVVDQTTVVATHLAELIRKHAQELLGTGRDQAAAGLDGRQPPEAGRRAGAEVDDPGRGAEGAAAAAAGAGLDSGPGSDSGGVGRDAPQNKSLHALVEAGRQALGRRLTQSLVDADGTLRVFALEPGLEEELMALVAPDASARQLSAGETSRCCGGSRIL